MGNLAYAILDGNLTADPEFKTVGNGKKVSTFSLAVNHNERSRRSSASGSIGDGGAANNDVSYIDIEAWDKVAENCSEFLKKVRKVTNKKDGSQSMEQIDNVGRSLRLPFDSMDLVKEQEKKKNTETTKKEKQLNFENKYFPNSEEVFFRYIRVWKIVF